MSKIEVNAIEPQSGTTLTLGASGDTITIPAGATISNSGTAAGFGPTGAVSWNTTKITANPNPAVSGVGYFCDTSSAAFTVTLPSSPSAGAVIGIADYANTFATNNLTVNRNGSNIGGVAANATLSTNGLSVTFVYVDATQGWIVTDSGNRSDLPAPDFVTATGGTVLTCGDYKTHVFTGPGSFVVSSSGNPLGSSTVEYLVVAGGGGGSAVRAGGGGAGGYRQNYPSPVSAGFSVSATTYPITVGAGGAGLVNTPPISCASSTPGSNSVFSTITSAGGGGAKYFNTGVAGGSGGGGSLRDALAGGAGNTPPVSPPQGNPGGNALPGSVGGTGGGGGGGGASAAGGNATVPIAGAGGAGSPIATALFGPTSPSYGTPGPAPGRYFAGGGGGGTAGPSYSPQAPIVAGAGGSGGGAAGGSPSVAAANGTTNTGGGGGGGSSDDACVPANGGSGGSGIVVIRYKFQ